MNQYKLKYKPLGSIAMIIEWPKMIDEDILHNISRFRDKIHSDMGEFVLETVPAYNSLAVFFDTTKIKYSLVLKLVKNIYAKKDQKLLTSFKLWKIPVCYDEEFGIDLQLISKEKGIPKDKIIAMHSKPLYNVHMIGFLPGFMYLGGLPEELAQPRKDKPRQAVRQGDVGIAGNQTGIYPRVSPGGWNIVGNSPLRFFDPEAMPPCFAVAGDKVKFVPIGREEHEKLRLEAEKGVFLPESEVYG